MSVVANGRVPSLTPAASLSWWALQRSSEWVDYSEQGTGLLMTQGLQCFAQARIHGRQFLHNGLVKNFMRDLLVAVGKDIA